jgi:hypothetical protein
VLVALESTATPVIHGSLLATYRPARDGQMVVPTRAAVAIPSPGAHPRRGSAARSRTKFTPWTGRHRAGGHRRLQDLPALREQDALLVALLDRGDRLADGAAAISPPFPTGMPRCLRWSETTRGGDRGPAVSPSTTGRSIPCRTGVAAAAAAAPLRRVGAPARPAAPRPRRRGCARRPPPSAPCSRLFFRSGLGPDRQAALLDWYRPACLGVGIREGSERRLTSSRTHRLVIAASTAPYLGGRLRCDRGDLPHSIARSSEDARRATAPTCVWCPCTTAARRPARRVVSAFHSARRGPPRGRLSPTASVERRAAGRRTHQAITGRRPGRRPRPAKVDHTAVEPPARRYGLPSATHRVEPDGRPGPLGRQGLAPTGPRGGLARRPVARASPMRRGPLLVMVALPSGTRRPPAAGPRPRGRTPARSRAGRRRRRTTGLAGRSRRRAASEPPAHRPAMGRPGAGDPQRHGRRAPASGGCGAAARQPPVLLLHGRT